VTLCNIQPLLPDWIGLSSVLRPRRDCIGYMGDGFYRSIVLKEHTVQITQKIYNNQTYKHKTQQIP